MTLLPWEDEPAPPPPQVNALARSLARIMQAAWASGRPEPVTLSKGLTVTAFIREDELHLALTREGSDPSLDEAETVARDAGWASYHHAWQRGNSGRQGLLLTRAERAPPPVIPASTTDPCVAIRALLRADPKRGATQEQWDAARGRSTPREEVIKVLLSRPNSSYPPDLAQQASDARASYLKGQSIPDLLDELDWFWRHWGGQPAEAFTHLQNVMTPSFD